MLDAGVLVPAEDVAVGVLPAELDAGAAELVAGALEPAEVAVAMQAQTAEAEDCTASAESTPQALRTHACAADCRAADDVHWQA